MEAVRIVQAKERMDRLDFSGQVEYTEHVVHIGAYQCPWCNKRVDFLTENFEKHETMNHSNLDAIWRIRFDDARPLESSRWESFVDFHCPGCNAPVRIIYEAGDEWSMGVHSWHLKEVLEAQKWPMCAD